MKIRFIFLICIFWILGVTLYFFTTADGLRDKYTYENDSVELPNKETLIVGSGKLDPYVFKIDDYYKVNRIYYADDFAEDANIWEVTYADGFVYLLLETIASDGPRDVEIFNILKLDENMNRIASSGWFDLSQVGFISDFTISDDIIAITQIDKNDSSVVYVYPLAVTDITVGSDVDEQNVRHVYTLNYTDYFESETGNEIFYAAYRDGVLIKYEDMSGDVPDELFSKRAERLYNNKILTPSQVIYLNRKLFMNCMAILVLGLATIISLYIILSRRNRIAYMIFIWELMMAALFVTTIWINGRKAVVFASAGTTFVIGSVAGIFVLLLQAADLKLFMMAMAKVSRGRHDINKPKTIGGDMNGLWNALFDLIRAIKSMNYNMFKIYEGYYKFAPKMIENHLMKNSVADVMPGNHTKLNLSLAHFYSKDSFDEEVATNIFEKIADLQEENKGSFLSSNPDLSEIDIILPNENNAICDSIMGINGLFDLKKSCVLIHNDNVNYSIVGDNRQNAVLVNSPDSKEMFSQISALANLGLSFVLTKEAYEHEAEKPLVRKIGWFDMSANRKIELYEVLDILPEKEKRLKVDSMSIFDEAMSYVISKDFYQARNLFARILKTNPKDEVARFYLFKCEDCISIENNKVVDFGFNR